MSKITKLEREIQELKSRLLSAYNEKRKETEHKRDWAKHHRKQKGAATRKLGWKADAEGYRSARVGDEIWGRKQTPEGSLSCWILVCGFEIHLVRMQYKRREHYYRGTILMGSGRVISKSLIVHRSTHVAKALNEMFRERLKVTFKI